MRRFAMNVSLDWSQSDMSKNKMDEIDQIKEEIELIKLQHKLYIRRLAEAIADHDVQSQVVNMNIRSLTERVWELEKGMSDGS